MEIEIEEKITRKIEVTFPRYTKGSGSYYYNPRQGCSVGIYPPIGDVQYYNTNTGLHLEECTKEEVEEAFNKVIAELKERMK